MNAEAILNTLHNHHISAPAHPGKIIVCDAEFTSIRVQDSLSNWIFPAFLKNADGSFTRIN